MPNSNFDGDRRRALRTIPALIAPRRLVWAPLFGLTGCGGLPPANLKAPQVEVSEIQFGEVSLALVKFALNLAVFNPNQSVLALSQLTVEVDLLDQPFARGNARQAYFELPATATSNVPIEFSVPTARIRALARSIALGAGNPYHYRVKGSANWGRDGIALPFQRTGEWQALKRLFELLHR